jgi:hypothetical protein
MAAFRLATFLVTAARDVVDEPAIYAPFRMIDAVDRLIAGQFDDDFLREIQPELEREKNKVMTVRDAFLAWLDGSRRASPRSSSAGTSARKACSSTSGR